MPAAQGSIDFSWGSLKFLQGAKDVLVYIRNTFTYLLKMQLGSLKKDLISSPVSGVVLELAFMDRWSLSAVGLKKGFTRVVCGKTGSL